jgi:phage terminase large subunit-like protein
VFFSGEAPESLRGPQCELCVIDEMGRMRYQQAVFDTMMLGLRLGDRLRVRAYIGMCVVPASPRVHYAISEAIGISRPSKKIFAQVFVD